MHFVEKVHPLNADIVVLGGNHIRVILELLDIDHGDFRFAGMVVDDLSGFDGAAKGFAGIDGVDDQTATAEFSVGLSEQIQPVDDEIKLGDDVLVLEVIGQKAHVVIGQRGFSAALGMPDDAFFDAVVQFALDGFGGE